ncbi:hypothetical protein BC937DRAFT_94633 [Endogone sp. FLAS-F59071]|nr:hypothetical protein BC937DRAFT_94633 [Endogone sp. FLAS-F59071]RUS13888.1 hypothetical protein BC937DRAFT_94633 [Endogone sp. FLAS-F59071]|eukprot:RUS13887.1 hypothetical protein BC937DRAFT_94633 [Endogone sp. FLAS-F59071]
MTNVPTEQLTRDQEYERYSQEYERYSQLVEQESGWGRVIRKAKEEPFVPFGIGLTCFALIAATIGFRQGNRVYANRMLRLRVASQGLTIAAAIAGSYYYSQKHEEKLIEQRKKLVEKQ